MSKSLNDILSNLLMEINLKLIPILQDIQSNMGYLPEEAIIEVSKFTGVPESEIYGVATFYTQFRFLPVGKKHIMVCKGTACHVKGATTNNRGN